MTKKIIPYEAGKVFLLLLELAAVCAAGYGAGLVLWYGVQLVLSPVPASTMHQAAGAVPEKVGFLRELLNFLATDVTKDEALHQMLRGGIFLAAGLAVLGLGRSLLKTLELRFRQRFMPVVLKEQFTDFHYEAKRRRAVEEILCDVGLLRRVERYYTANRLDGLYRDCWVAAEEIVCGGVYGEHYTRHTVKVRGQWLTVRLNCDFDCTIILESRGTKNRFTHRALAKTMCELELDYDAFADAFVCYTTTPEEARGLLTREMAGKLLQLLEKYPDLVVIFRQGCVHLLIRRRSFNRRWEFALPFCLPLLRREVLRLYGPLQDFTDLLLT